MIPVMLTKDYFFIICDVGVLGVRDPGTSPVHLVQGPSIIIDGP